MNFKQQRYSNTYSRIVKLPVVEYDAVSQKVIYRPTGDYHQNRLTLEMNFEAGGLPLLGAGVQIPGLSSPHYSPSVSYAPPNTPSSLFILKDGEMMTEDVNINLVEFSTFVGDSGDVDHWQYQGLTNACMFAAAASSINSYNYNQGTYQEIMGVRVWVPKKLDCGRRYNLLFPIRR